MHCQGGLKAQLTLMKTVAHSLKILHDIRIVHGDHKPSNILIKRTELGHTTKLTDFDSAYVAGRPPPPEEIVGTINYAPELLGCIQEAGVSPGELGAASDIFALGLIYTEYLTGSPPPFDAATHHEPVVAVRSGQTLRVPRTGLPQQLADLVDAMLSTDAVRRPTIAHVHATLMTIRPDNPADGPPPSPTNLRGKGLKGVPSSAAATGPRRASSLVGKLVQIHRHNATMSAVWRCRICEGVNQGGRICGTCGTVVPPAFEEVLVVRAGRQAMVRTFLAGVTAEELAGQRRNPHSAGGDETVLSCLRTILEEEWEHHRYAVRDLDSVAVG